jgi:hypothetical protein
VFVTHVLRLAALLEHAGTVTVNYKLYTFVAGYDSVVYTIIFSSRNIQEGDRTSETVNYGTMIRVFYQTYHLAKCPLWLYVPVIYLFVALSLFPLYYLVA